MHAKVPKEPSAAQAVVVAVTNKIKKGLSLTLLTFMVLGYQNCMVELSPSTPGAASSSCSPDSTALSEFQIVESTMLLAAGPLTGGLDGCVSCHGANAASSGKAVYLIFGTVGSNDTATSIKNFCTMELKGKSKMVHPQEAHSGGVYAPTDFPDYYTLVNKYF